MKIDGIKMENFDLSKIFSYMDQEEYIFAKDMKTNVSIFNAYSVTGLNKVRDIFQKEMYAIISNSKNCKTLSSGEKK